MAKGGQSCAALLTCSMTPTACLWLSNRAGEGAAGSSASVDILSRTVPITRVLHTEYNVTAYTTVLKSSGDGNNNNRIIENIW